MKRPADQAKLLFLYLLRSSAAAAWATETKAMVGGGSAHSASVVTATAASIMPPKPTTPTPTIPPLFEGSIQLRLARRADVPCIQRCNVATLPENYHTPFYLSHLRQWPDLALVAEHVTPETSRRKQNSFQFDPSKPPPNIVAYVLGKVEEQPVSHDGTMAAGSAVVGHVTSLAVLQQYRRQGLAASLMEQLHFHLQAMHGVNSVGLHVRVSNVAATRLYERDGYHVHTIIPNYYQDGEDAYYMNKILPQVKQDFLQPNTIGPSKSVWGSLPPRRFRRKQPWEVGPAHLRLPRVLVESQQEDTSIMMQGGDEDRLMTGTF